MDTYEPLRLLGEGSFGKVYLMRHRVKDKTFCVKVIKVGNLSTKEREKCLGEVSVMRRLNHPNLVRLEEHFLSRRRDSLFIVMQYCDGGDLSEQIKNTLEKKRLFSERKIMSWFAQATLALQYMHSNRVLHRDLKTQNIFLLGNGRLVLGDFGISKDLDGEMDFTKTIIGTPYYMSPEIMKSQSYNSKSDVWALGCVLHEMCTLKHPFQAASLNGLAESIISGNVPPISAQYSRPLKRLVTLLLTTDPKRRPSCNDILRLPFVKKRVADFFIDIASRPPSLLGEGTMAIRNAILLNDEFVDNGPFSEDIATSSSCDRGDNSDLSSLQEQLKEIGLNSIIRKALGEDIDVSSTSKVEDIEKVVKRKQRALQTVHDREELVGDILRKIRTERAARAHKTSSRKNDDNRRSISSTRSNGSNMQHQSDDGSNSNSRRESRRGSTTTKAQINNAYVDGKLNSIRRSIESPRSSIRSYNVQESEKHTFKNSEQNRNGIMKQREIPNNIQVSKVGLGVDQIDPDLCPPLLAEELNLSVDQPTQPPIVRRSLSGNYMSNSSDSSTNSSIRPSPVVSPLSSPRTSLYETSRYNHLQHKKRSSSTSISIPIRDSTALVNDADISRRIQAKQVHQNLNLQKSNGSKSRASLEPLSGSYHDDNSSLSPPLATPEKYLSLNQDNYLYPTPRSSPVNRERSGEQVKLEGKRKSCSPYPNQFFNNKTSISKERADDHEKGCSLVSQLESSLAEQDEDLSFLNEADETNIENDLKAREDAVKSELRKTNKIKLEMKRTLETYESLLRTKVDGREEYRFEERKYDLFSNENHTDRKAVPKHLLAAPKESYNTYQTENNLESHQIRDYKLGNLDYDNESFQKVGKQGGRIRKNTEEKSRDECDPNLNPNSVGLEDKSKNSDEEYSEDSDDFDYSDEELLESFYSADFDRSVDSQDNGEHRSPSLDHALSISSDLGSSEVFTLSPASLQKIDKNWEVPRVPFHSSDISEGSQRNGRPISNCTMRPIDVPYMSFEKSSPFTNKNSLFIKTENNKLPTLSSSPSPRSPTQYEKKKFSLDSKAVRNDGFFQYSSPVDSSSPSSFHRQTALFGPNKEKSRDWSDTNTYDSNEGVRITADKVSVSTVVNVTQSSMSQVSEHKQPTSLKSIANRNYAGNFSRPSSDRPIYPSDDTLTGHDEEHVTKIQDSRKSRINLNANIVGGNLKDRADYTKKICIELFGEELFRSAQQVIKEYQSQLSEFPAEIAKEQKEVKLKKLLGKDKYLYVQHIETYVLLCSTLSEEEI